jgi:NTP pyrophosphatase (non-canonical NTP hydrolase)
LRIAELQTEVKQLLDEKGFAYDKSTFWEKVALAHTEISELADAVKKKGFSCQEDIEAEFADIIIRTMNFALMFEFDAEKAIANKMAKNFERPYKFNTYSEGEK